MIIFSSLTRLCRTLLAAWPLPGQIWRFPLSRRFLPPAETLRRELPVEARSRTKKSPLKLWSPGTTKPTHHVDDDTTTTARHIVALVPVTLSCVCPAPAIPELSSPDELPPCSRPVLLRPRPTPQAHHQAPTAANNTSGSCRRETAPPTSARDRRPLLGCTRPLAVIDACVATYRRFHDYTDHSTGPSTSTAGHSPEPRRIMSQACAGL